MRRYINLYKAFLKNNLEQILQFRLNFLLRLILSFLWMGINFLSVNLIYSQTQTIAGFTKEQMILFTAVFYVANALIRMFFYDNVAYIPQKINRGELDMILTKPLNGKFYISTIKINLFQIFRAILGIIIAFRYTQIVNNAVTVKEIVFTITSFILGIFAMYNFLFILACFGFIRPRIWNLFAILGNIKNLASYPSKTYKGVVRYFITFTPIIAISTIPTLFLMGRGTYNLIILTLFLTIFFALASNMSWNLGLKRYESASS